MTDAIADGGRAPDRLGLGLRFARSVLTPMKGTFVAKDEIIDWVLRYTWDSEDQQEVLRSIVQDAIGALWSTDGTWERIRAADFTAASRAAVRTQGGGHWPCP